MEPTKGEGNNEEKSRAPDMCPMKLHAMDGEAARDVLKESDKGRDG